ncbi:MAG: isoprenylcysteine carboxyl methyltransferase [Gemmatimonadetes bacterium]|nr:isoprenylcysteine carboxyl methyltransferase [Gemmatimonadota bacterium]
MVAGIIPAWLLRRSPGPALPLGPFYWLGLPLGGAGLGVLLVTIVAFATRGHGTLAPWDAPTALVHGGLYRRTRNPMYLGVLGLLLGQALWWASGGLLLYALAIAAAFQVRVIGYEEPALARQFGAAYADYRRSVPRWLPRLR